MNITTSKIPDYVFSRFISDYDGLTEKYHITETGMSFKFACKENFVTAPSGKAISVGTEIPIVWFNFRKGITVLGGDFTYSKYELKVMELFTTPLIGQSQFVFVAGKTYGKVPVTNLYNGHASYARFTIDAEYTFATMRMDEFYATDFISLFIKQNIGKNWFNKKDFHPYLSLITNLGVGKLTNTDNQYPPAFTSFNKGYYESGVLVNNLLISGKIINIGLGMFYRYGPYAFGRTADNFCYRLALNFILK
jgi:hypothetical protein